jgi:hypothetical protein
MTTYYFLKRGEEIQRISLEGDPPVVAEVLQIGLIEPNCKVNVSFNLVSDKPAIFCHQQKTGDVFFYWDDRGRYERSLLTNISVGWKLQLVQLHRGDGITYIFGHNRDPNDPDYQKIQIWNIDGPPTPIELGKIGTEWDLMLGDVNADTFVDIVGRRTTTNTEGKAGDLKVWFVTIDTGPRWVVTERPGSSGNIGLAWNLQVADIDANSNGFADLFGSNADGDLWVWYNVADENGRGRFNSGHTYGTLGRDWKYLQVAHLRTGSRAVDILGLAPSNGEVHGWFTNSTGIDGQGVTVGSNASDWIPLAGFPQTRLA